jgi:hypothetical protein
MRTVRLASISISEAEDILAELWCRLEECGIETPGIKLTSGSDGTVSLLLSFGSSHAAALALGRGDCSPGNVVVTTMGPERGPHKR